MAATIPAIFAAMEAQIRAALPAIKTVGAINAVTGHGINTPAALIDVEGMREGQDDGQGQLPVVLRFVAYCILSTATDKAEIEIQNFATELFRLVRRNTWGIQGVDIPENLEAVPADFGPDKPGYEIWAVTWEQTIRVGGSVWEGGSRPSTVFLGVAPDIGPPHVDDYRQMAP